MRMPAFECPHEPFQVGGTEQGEAQGERAYHDELEEVCPRDSEIAAERGVDDLEQRRDCDEARQRAGEPDRGGIAEHDRSYRCRDQRDRCGRDNRDRGHEKHCHRRVSAAFPGAARGRARDEARSRDGQAEQDKRLDECHPAALQRVETEIRLPEPSRDHGKARRVHRKTRCLRQGGSRQVAQQ